MSTSALTNTIKYGGAVILILLLTMVLDVVQKPETTAGMVRTAESIAIDAGVAVPPNTFVYDGCSLWFDYLLWHDLTSACLQHDMVYWAGGGPARRRNADIALRDTISHTGPLGPSIGAVMYVGVRLLGDTTLSRALDVNWGYGWNE